MSRRHPASGEACPGHVKSDTDGIDDGVVGVGVEEENDAIERRIRALFVTLEFSSHSFSGNGTLAQACVRGLAAAGVDVTVLSATPREQRARFDIENDTDDDDDETEKNETETQKARRQQQEEEKEEEQKSRLHGASRLVEVPVPSSLWGRLDARSPWREFRDGASEEMKKKKKRNNDDSPLLSSSSPFDVVFAVDWTGVAAAEAVFPSRSQGSSSPSSNSPPPPLIYLNFRVFSRTAGEGDEAEMVRRAEGRAVALSAAATAALCDDDAAALSALARSFLLLSSSSGAAGDEGEKTPPLLAAPPIDVVLPPLRREFEEMPPPNLDDAEEEEEEEESEEENENETTSSCGGSEKENEERNGQQQRQHQRRQRRRGRKNRKRNLLLCCVRLSAEKEPHRFVDVVEALAESGALRELQLTPALVGGGDSDYARGVRERLVAAVAKGKRGGGKKEKDTSAVVEVEVEVEGGFVGAAELASRFMDKTLLNFHPCLADAYGMSAVEAASRGAASVIHRGRAEGDENEKVTVGASALLRPERGESFALDLSLPASVVAEQVASIVRDGSRLREVARRASKRARSWSERESGERLASLARRVLFERATE